MEGQASITVEMKGQTENSVGIEDGLVHVLVVSQAGWWVFFILGKTELTVGHVVDCPIYGSGMPFSWLFPIIPLLPLLLIFLFRSVEVLKIPCPLQLNAFGISGYKVG